MAQTIKLKRSATAGQVPTQAQLALGEVAINTTDGKIFIKKFVDGTDANDLILELAPATAGSALPGITSSATAPTSAASGQIWFDSTSNALKSWNGSQWESLGIIRSDTQPADSTVTAGDLWFDSDIARMFLYNGTAWVGVGGGAAVESTAPTNPNAGDLWYDSETKTLSVYDNVGNWNSLKGGAGGAELDSDKANLAPQPGAIFYDSETKTLKIYDNAGAWNPVKGGASIDINPPSTPQSGDLWFDDSETGRLYVYNAGAWIDASPALKPDDNIQTFNTFKFVADSDQVLFTGTDANGRTLATTGYMIVALNGVILDANDYTYTSTTVTLTTAAALSDELTVLAFSVASVAGTVSTTEDTTVNANLTINGKLSVDSEIVVTGAINTTTAIAATRTATLSADETLNFKAHQNFVLTLGANITLLNPTTEAVGQSGFITFIQDATGGRTVSLGTQYKTAGGTGLTLSTTAGAIDMVPYVAIAADTILLGQPQLAFA